MHVVTRSIALSFAQKAPRDIGETFSYHKVYFSVLNGKPVTVEQFIPGTFNKYIKNTGLVSIPENDDLKETYDKAECFSHFSYSETNRETMILDLQGARYKLYGPEIATSTLRDDDGDEFIFLYREYVLESNK